MGAISAAEAGIVVRADGVIETVNGLKLTGDNLRKVGEAAKQAETGTKALRDAHKGLSDSTKNAANDADSYVAKLKQEASEIGKTRLEILALKADKLGLSEAQKKAANDSIEAIAAHKDQAKAIDQVRYAAAAAGLTVTALAAGLYIKTKAAIDTSAALQTLSDKTGVSVEKLSAMKYATDLTDTSIESLARSMKQLPRSIAEAQNPNSAAGRAFNFLEIDPNSIKTQEQGINAIADAIKRVEDPMARSAALSLIFKRNGEELLPFFMLGSEGLRRLAAEGNEWANISGINAERAKQLKDDMVRLNYATSEFSKSLAALVAGPLSDLIGRFLEAKKLGGGGLYELFLGPNLTKDPGAQLNELNKTLDAIKKSRAEISNPRNADGSPSVAYLIGGGEREDFDKQIKLLESRKALLQLAQRQEVLNGARGQDYGDQNSRRQASEAGRITGGADLLGPEQKDKKETGYDSWSKRATDLEAQAQLAANAERKITESEKALARFRAEIEQGDLKLKPGQQEEITGRLQASAAIERGRITREEAGKALAGQLQDEEKYNTEWAAIQTQKNNAYKSSRESVVNATRQSEIAGIVDSRARAIAQFDFERDMQQKKINDLAPFDDQRKDLEDQLAQWYVARQAQLAEDLKPQYQKMLDGWQDTTRAMRDNWDSMHVSVINAGEQMAVAFGRSGKLSGQAMIQAFQDEISKSVYRKYFAPGVSAGVDYVAGFLGMGGGSQGAAASQSGAVGMTSADDWMLAGLHHSGGIAGRPAQKEYVSPSVFSSARRYHAGGLAGDEVPAILRRGEEVLTENDPRHRANGGAQQSVRVEIVNQGGAPKAVTSVQPRIDVDGVVVRVFLDDLRNNGPIAQRMDRFSTRKMA